MTGEFEIATKAVTAALTDAVVQGHPLTLRSGIVLSTAMFEYSEEIQGFDSRLVCETGHFIPDFFITGVYTFKAASGVERQIVRSAACFAVSHAHQSAMDRLNDADVLSSAVAGDYRVTYGIESVTVRAKLRIARGDSVSCSPAPRRPWLDVARDALAMALDVEAYSDDVASLLLEHDVDSTGAGLITMRLNLKCAREHWSCMCVARNVSTLFCAVFDENAVSGGFHLCDEVEHTVVDNKTVAITIPFTLRG